MSIKVSGCTVIDDSRNITNANNMCVGVVTMTGSTGNIETPGTITAAEFIADTAPEPILFNPSDGAIEIEINSQIIITFDQVITKNTGNITLREDSASGTVIETLSVSSNSVTISNGTVVTVVPSNLFANNQSIYVVIDADTFRNSSGIGNELLDTYNFTSRNLALGDPYEGGFLICQTGGVRWVVAPASTQVNAVNISPAVTNAQNLTGCSGWFVPDCSTLRNPGYNCRTYWDSFSSGPYRSTSGAGGYRTAGINFANGVEVIFANPQVFGPGSPGFGRAFRCVTY